MDDFTPIEFQNCFAENALKNSARKEQQKNRQRGFLRCRFSIRTSRNEYVNDK